jgi:hypothetical protein
VLSFELAREILRDPDQWPGDLAQRAAEKIGTRSASKAATLAATAKAGASSATQLVGTVRRQVSPMRGP